MALFDPFSGRNAFAVNIDIGAFAVAYHPRATTFGVSSASFTVTLAKNTVVERFDVVVAAPRAQQTAVENVAQVRAYSGTDQHLIIDFGLPRTVSAISVQDPVTITKVSAWTGAAFAQSPFYEPKSPTSDAVFASEVRSERLLVVVSAKITDPDKNVKVELPDPPSDLEIRINGGAPVWSNPGPVEPSTPGWDANSTQIVSLRDALNALLSDPTSDAKADYEITLTAKVPGLLAIAEKARSFSFINRIAFDGDTSKTLDFAEEGVVSLPLPAANAARVIKEIRLTALGNPPPERVRPAAGPPAATAPDGSLTAELLLDPQHAACVRLSKKTKLAELTAIRLPLVTDADGAEASVVLWEDDGGPSKPLPNGASKPSVLTAAPPETWTRFAFAKPVPIDMTKPPWVAVLVARGTVTWPLASMTSAPDTRDDDLRDENVLRRGAPNGPWQPLPAPLTSGFLAARGRVRAAGNAAKDAPIDPLRIVAFGKWKDVTPAAKGATVKIETINRFVEAHEAPALLVVSRTAGSVTLRDVDVVWSPPAPGTL